MEHLKSFFEGSDYNQTLKLFYENHIVFSGVADDLVTSTNGELQILFNFSGERNFLHSLRRSGDFVLFVPMITDINADIYLKFVRGVVLAWPLKYLENLWRQFRYNPEELKKIRPASSDELFLIWLISSQYFSVQSLDLSNMSSVVSKNILAEDPEGVPSTKNIIYNLKKRDILLESVYLFAGSDDNAVTVYLNDGDKSIIEWKSVLYDRNFCLIGGNLAISIISA